jgi:hypothetical protein
MVIKPSGTCQDTNTWVQIAQNRKMALLLIDRWHKDKIHATQEDVNWFWKDLKSSEDYSLEFYMLQVEPKALEIDQHYPFEITEWFLEFYRYMPDCLIHKWDGACEVDWHLFFCLAKPLYLIPGISFYSMISRLNIIQLRHVKDQIVDTVLEDAELLRRVVDNENLPPQYTYYLPWKSLKRRVEDKLLKKCKEIESGSNIS